MICRLTTRLTTFSRYGIASLPSPIKFRFPNGTGRLYVSALQSMTPTFRKDVPGKKFEVKFEIS